MSMLIKNKNPKNNIAEMIVGFVYPKKCCLCGEIMPYKSNDYVCKKCTDNLPWIISDKCPKCGRPWKYGGLCIACVNSEFIFSKGAAVFPYSKVRSAVHRLKFDGIKYQSEGFAYLMYLYLTKNENLNYKEADMLIPVPMYITKEKSRGFNQATLITQKLGEFINKPCVNGVLIKQKNTESQSTLPPAKRRQNVKHAYKVVDKDKIKDKFIILIDDVLTTGSTINECSEALLKAGAKRVEVFTFAAS